MEVTDALVEFAKILIPASLLLYLAYLLVRTFVQKEVELRRLEVRSRAMETVLPSRLQAYERMTLFLERISPQNMLIRLNTAPMPYREFQQLLLSEMRNEYNHNASQQVYMSEDVWNLIKSAREDMTVTINEAATEMHPDANSLDLSKKIFEKFLAKPVDPVNHALSELKREIQRTF